MPRERNNPILLDDRETFELYEKRSLRSPTGHYVPPPRSIPLALNYRIGDEKHRSDRHTEHIVLESDDLMPSKRKLPLPWIVCAAVGVPIFVIVTLFLAVWLQELGFI